MRAEGAGLRRRCAPANRALGPELAEQLTAGRAREFLGIAERARGQHDAELVTAQACDQRSGVGGGDRAECVRNPAQQRVPDGMAVAIVDLLEAIDVADQQRRGRVRGSELAQALVQPAAIGQSREGILVGELRDLAEQLGSADRHRHLRGDRLQQPDVVGSESAAACSGSPQLAPHHGLVHDRHRQLAFLAELSQHPCARRVGVGSIDGGDMDLSSPEQLGDRTVLGQRILLIVWPAQLARPELADVDERSQHTALTLPAADREGGRIQRRERLAGDRLQRRVQAVSAQHRLRNAQYGSQRTWIVTRRRLEQIEHGGLGHAAAVGDRRCGGQPLAADDARRGSLGAKAHGACIGAKQRPLDEQPIKHLIPR